MKNHINKLEKERIWKDYDYDYVNTDEAYFNMITESNYEKKDCEKDMIKIILDECMNYQNDKKQRRSRFNSIAKASPKEMIPIFIQIIQNYLNKMTEEQQLALIIFIKNYFKKFAEKVDNNTNLIRNGLKEQSENFSYIYENMFQEINDMTYVIIKYLHVEETDCSQKMKIFFKECIENLMSICINLNIDNDDLYDKIYSEILDQFTKNLENCLTEKLLVKLLNIFECLITLSRKLIFDNNDFDNQLILIELILNNFSKIKYENVSRDDTITEEDRVAYPDHQNVCKIKLLNAIVDVINKIIENRLNILIKTSYSGVLFHNNIKFLKIIEFILYLDPFNLSIGDYLNLIKNEVREFKLCQVKYSLINKLIKTLHISCNIYNYNNCPNFFEFCNKLFEDYIKSFEASNKEFNFANLKDTNCEELEFNLFINSVILFLIECLKLKKSKEIFENFHVQIFRYVILPCLKTNLSEKEAYFIDSEEFIRIAYDLTFNFSLDNIRSKMLKFLVKLINTFDNFSFFICEFYIELLIFQLKRDLIDIDFNFKFKYFSCETYNFLTDYIINYFSSEEIYDNIFQVLATIQSTLYKSNNSAFRYIDYYLVQLNPILNTNKIEFICCKIMAFYFSNIKVKLKTLMNLGLNEARDIIKKNDLSLQINFIFEKAFNSLILNNNFTLNILAMNFLNDLLFYKPFITNEVIKTFLNEFVRNNRGRLKDVLLLSLNCNFLSSENSTFNYLIINFIKHYTVEVESEYFPIFNYSVKYLVREIDNYYMHIKKFRSDKRATRYFTPQTTQNFVKVIDQILRIIFISNDLILRNNICNIYIENILLNTNKMLNFQHEEELIYLNILILDNFTDINLCNYIPLVGNFINEIREQKFQISDYHVNYINKLIHLAISSSKEVIVKFKNDIINLFKCGIMNSNSDITKYTLEHYFFVSFFISFVLNFSSFGQNGNYLEITDYESLILLIHNRIYSKLLNNYPGPFTSRLYLLFQLIYVILYEENKINNLPLNFDYLVNKCFYLCGDHSTLLENSLTLLFCFRHLNYVLNENTNKIFSLLIRSLEFTIQQLSYLTFKNIPQCELNEQELEAIYRTGKSKGNLSQIIPNSLMNKSAGLSLNFYDQSDKYKSKKLFGIKNSRKSENLLEECNKNSKNKNYDDINYNLKEYESSDDSSSYNYNVNEQSNEEDEDIDKLNDNSINDDENESDNEIFMLNLEQEDQLKKFNNLMTAEKFLKRKRIEYTLKFKQNKYQVDKLLAQNFNLINLINNSNEFLTLKSIFDGIMLKDELIFKNILNSLPKYVKDLWDKIKSYNKITIKYSNTVEDYQKLIKKHRKILSIKRNNL